jgi:hypothetical protein
MAADATRFRVRRLTHAGPGERAHQAAPRDSLGQLSEEAGKVYPIAAQESELPAEEILTHIRRGELASNDLVFENGAWAELVDSVAFGEAAARRVRWESLARVTPYVLVLLVPPLLVLALMIGLSLRH